MSIACAMYLKIGGFVGAVMFSFALCLICVLELPLFTGRIGLLGKEKQPYMTILVSNLLGCGLMGFLISLTDPSIGQIAADVISKKTEIGFIQSFIKGCLCGVLMYLAVQSWRGKFEIGTIMCVAVFILSGFEHSIADFGYMSMSKTFIWNIIPIVVGNAIGAVVCRLAVEE